MSVPAPPSAGAFPSPPGGFAPTPPPSTRRNVELLLLGFAAVMVTTALLLVEASKGQSITWDIAKYGAAFLGLYAIAHAAVRRLAPLAVPPLRPSVAVLIGLGLVLIRRLDLGAVQNAVVNGVPVPAPGANHQIVWTALGMVLFVGVLVVLRDYRTLASY